MEFGLKSRLGRWLTQWLTKESHSAEDTLLYDFDRLCYEIRPGDVILVEGRSRVSDVIKLITQTTWTHAALYVGRLYDIHDGAMQNALREHFDGDPKEQLIIEALLGEGTVVHPISKYRQAHLRICRPKGLAPLDAQKVIAYAIGRLGSDYDVRQLLDLARFMFPFWGIIPRRWRSSLFQHNAGEPTRTVCSSMLGAAFNAVHFPVRPFVEKTADGKLHLYKRNPRLFTPRDFDHSPYFDIIKYPYFGLDDISIYQRLPWGSTDQYCNDVNDCYRIGAAAPSDAPAVPASPAMKSGAAPSSVHSQQVNLLKAMSASVPDEPALRSSA